MRAAGAGGREVPARVLYGASIASLPIARRANGQATGAGLALLIAGGLLVCAWAAAQSELRSWLMLGGLLAAGALLYAFASLGRRKALV